MQNNRAFKYTNVSHETSGQNPAQLITTQLIARTCIKTFVFYTDNVALPVMIYIINRTTRQREIFKEVKAAASAMPEDFDWEIAAMNSEANALDADDQLACFKATLEVYVDQKVHEF